jgi:hypothetical protein
MLAVALLLLPDLAPPSRAAEGDYRALLRRLPDSTTAVILVDVKALRQALGVAPGTELRTPGLSGVPAMADKFVLGSHIDLSERRHLWSVGLAALDRKMTMQDLAKAEGEPVEQVAGHPAVVSPRNAYFVELGPGLLAAATPANRKMLSRWLAFQDANKLDALPPYLLKAADAAGSAVAVLALDLEDSVDMTAIRRGLNRSPVLASHPGADLDAVARTLAKVKGVRLAVRPGSPLAGELTVDFDADTYPVQDFAKPLLLEVLQNAGLHLSDFDDWEAKREYKTVTLRGPLSVNGMRKLGMLIKTPAPGPAAADPNAARDATPAARALAASQHYFQSVKQILDDLKNDKGKALDSRAGWYEQAAGQFDNLPTLDVDPDLLAYGTGTAERLRDLAKGQKDAASKVHYVKYNSWASYMGPMYGNRQTGYVPTAKVTKGLEEQAAEARRGMWDQIENATAQIRQRMSQKFNAQF